MYTYGLNLKETKEMLLYVADKMIESKELLTEADKAIGDGDHGIGMATGFEAVREKLNGNEFDSLDGIFKAVGFALMMSIGGASGAIFGTMYQGAAKSFSETTTFDSNALHTMLDQGLKAVKNRGKSKPGDKTMVDALEPAAITSRAYQEDGLEKALSATSEAAGKGVENTKTMVATMGRAKSLGERALGYPDPGAVSMHLILSFMNEYVKQHSQADEYAGEN